MPEYIINKNKSICNGIHNSNDLIYSAYWIYCTVYDNSNPIIDIN